MRIRNLWVLVLLGSMFSFTIGAIDYSSLGKPASTKDKDDKPSYLSGLGTKPSTSSKTSTKDTSGKPSYLTGLKQADEPEKKTTLGAKKTTTKPGAKAADDDEEAAAKPAADDEEGAAKTPAKKLSRSAKAGKVIQKVVDNPLFQKVAGELASWGIDEAKKAAAKPREEAEAKAAWEQKQREAEFEYQQELKKLELEKKRQEILGTSKKPTLGGKKPTLREDVEEASEELSEEEEQLAQEKAELQKLREMKRKLDEAKKKAPAKKVVAAEEEEQEPATKVKKAAKPKPAAVRTYQEVLNEDFIPALQDPDFVEDPEAFLAKLRAFVYINIGGAPEEDSPEDLKEAYTGVLKFLADLTKKINADKIPSLKNKLKDIEKIKTMAKAIDIKDFVTELNTIVMQKRTDLLDKMLFIRGVGEWVEYAKLEKKAGRLTPEVEEKFVEVLKKIPSQLKISSGKALIDDFIKKLGEVKRPAAKKEVKPAKSPKTEEEGMPTEADIAALFGENVESEEENVVEPPTGAGD
jgi:hypothetical protein